MIIRPRSVTRAASALCVAAFAIAAVAACEKPSTANDASVCAAPASRDGGLIPVEGFANGSVSGQGVSANFCNAGASLSGYINGAAGPRALVTIDSTSYSASSVVTLPAAAVAGTLRVSLQIAQPVAGVYSSADGSACGNLSFSYGVLVAPGVDCDATVDVAPNTCPTGCTQTTFCGDRVDASAGYYACCVPLAKTFAYQATGGSACQGATAANSYAGSWTLTLTSVDPYDGDAGPIGNYETFYTVHGTLTATLQGFVDTFDTVDVALRF